MYSSCYEGGSSGQRWSMEERIEKNELGQPSGEQDGIVFECSMNRSHSLHKQGQCHLGPAAHRPSYDLPECLIRNLPGETPAGSLSPRPHRDQG